MPTNIMMADPKGEKIYYTDRGRAYAKNIEFTLDNDNFDPVELNGIYRNATELQTVKIHGTPWKTTIGLQNTFDGCKKLEEAIIEPVKKFSHYVFIRCSSLKKVVLGKIGNGVNALYNTFYGLTQSDLTITIYVDDDTPIPLNNSPWGASNATIIYRSSTTGEVRT